MGISIQAKTDVSFLFSGLSAQNNYNSLNSMSFLSDYASIKNGSYGKLMRAYYNKDASDEVKSVVNSSKSASQDDSVTIKNIRSDAGELMSAADKLLASGEESLFAQKEVEVKNEDGTTTKELQYDKDAIYSAVSKFAESYNNLLNGIVDSNNTRILSMGQSMVTSTSANAKLLAKVGITIGSDNTLSVDKEAFQKADMKTVESLFGATGSYGYGIQSKASFVDTYAKNDAAKASGLYTQDAVFTSTALGSGYNYSGII